MDEHWTGARMRDGTLDRRRAIFRDGVCAILREHGPGVSIDAVARQIGTSRRQLQRVFADFSDDSFYVTLRAIRMNRARKLLAESDKPIAEVGRAVGYPAPAQFSKAFRHLHGTSPRAYRQQRRGQAGAISAQLSRAPLAPAAHAGGAATDVR